MPEQHAILGPSSAARWMACPGSMCLSRGIEETTSVYAKEGTLAHSICELQAKKRYYAMIPGKYEVKLAELQAHELYDPEMMECADTYLELISEVVAEHRGATEILFEHTLNYDEYVQEGFGTGDCVIISSERIDVIDYKHGKGVQVEVADNPQLMIYGLAALSLPPLGAEPTIVGTHICQPRNGGNSSKLYEAEYIVEWGDCVLQVAGEKAWECYNTPAEFLSPSMLKPGKHCKFCKAKAICKERGKSVAVELFGKKDVHTYTDEELSEILKRAKDYKDWVEDVQRHCLKRSLSGKPIPGFKVVAGRGTRVFDNPEIALASLQFHGFDPEKFYVRKPMSVAQVEKAIGKKAFSKIGSQLCRTKAGEPTLAPDDDKRIAITGAEVFK